MCVCVCEQVVCEGAVYGSGGLCVCERVVCV